MKGELHRSKGQGGGGRATRQKGAEGWTDMEMEIELELETDRDKRDTDKRDKR